ncbi:hypothetical protein Aperf_G00000022732 [Anoplocephala perfoliata]
MLKSSKPPGRNTRNTQAAPPSMRSQLPSRMHRQVVDQLKDLFQMLKERDRRSTSSTDEEPSRTPHSSATSSATFHETLLVLLCITFAFVNTNSHASALKTTSNPLKSRLATKSLSTVIATGLSSTEVKDKVMKGACSLCEALPLTESAYQVMLSQEEKKSFREDIK